MATRGKAREPAERDADASASLLRMDAERRSERIAYYVPLRLRLAALVLVMLVSVKMLLVGQSQERCGVHTQTAALQLVNERGSALGRRDEDRQGGSEGSTMTPSEEFDESASTEAPELPPQEIPASEAPVLRDTCYYERDFGLIENASIPTHVFCAHGGALTKNVDEKSSNRTTVTLIDAPAGLRAVIFKDLLLNLTAAQPFRDIDTIAEDGGDHDPRFLFTRDMVHCRCEELHEHAKAFEQKHYQPFTIWGEALAFYSRWSERDTSLSCGAPAVDHLSHPSNETDSIDNLIEVPGRVLLIARRDDHNPFFQVSNALNAWIILQALQWDPQEVTLIHLDAGFPSPIDVLHQKLLAPSSNILHGRELMGKRVHFSGEVVLAPFETAGPMMQHLDDWEPCFTSKLFQVFRAEALKVMGATGPSHHNEETKTRSQKDIVVTFISRRPYNGRMVQRRWINEDEIIQQLQSEYTAYKKRSIVFQSVDFVGLSLQEQMSIMLASDVVVSMHGAGLVNVLWTRPGTLVLEVFPKKRRRWGYRNLCQFVGCDWHEFRGGTDIPTGRDANANDKSIAYEEWRTFFDYHFKSLLGRQNVASRHVRSEE